MVESVATTAFAVLLSWLLVSMLCIVFKLQYMAWQSSKGDSGMRREKRTRPANPPRGCLETHQSFCPHTGIHTESRITYRRGREVFSIHVTALGIRCVDVTDGIDYSISSIVNKKALEEWEKIGGVQIPKATTDRQGVNDSPPSPRPDWTPKGQGERDHA